MKPVFTVSSEDCMFDQPIAISLQGLKGKKLVTVHSFTTTDSGNSFESFAQYLSDDGGCVDLQHDKSLSGSYTGIEPMGLFWSMKPSMLNKAYKLYTFYFKKPHARLMKVDVTTPLVVTLRLFDGSVASMDEIETLRKKNELDQHELASVSLKRWMMAPGTKRIVMTLQNDGVYGTLFVPPGNGPFPGVVILFGNFPGTLEYKAALLASHGFAALALSFHDLPGLPSTQNDAEFKLEYFEKAVELMYQHKEVDNKSGIGVVGLSYSSYMVLAMGAHLKNVRCVIWINGFVYPMFSRLTYGEDVYDEVKYNLRHDKVKQEGSDVMYLRCIYPFYPDLFHPDLNKSRIKFYDRHDVSYMFISGLSDNSGPSEHHINQAEKLLKASKHPSYQLLRYPGAGHLIEPPFGSHHAITENKLNHVYIDWGGEPYAHCKAQEDSWLKQIEFLKSSLLPRSNSKL